MAAVSLWTRRLRVHSTIAFFIAISGAVCLSTFEADAQESQIRGERHSLIDDATCEVVGSGRFYESQDNKSFGFQLKPIIAYLQGRSIALVCRADIERYDTLSLQMGVSDQSETLRERMSLTIYQSGSVIVDEPLVEPGTVIPINIDLKSIEHGADSGNIAIKMECDRSNRQNSCVMYMLNARLSPAPNYRSSGSSSNQSVNPELEPVADITEEQNSDNKTMSFGEIMQGVRQIIDLF